LWRIARQAKRGLGVTLLQVVLCGLVREATH
jgi:hypothetical protein